MQACGRPVEDGPYYNRPALSLKYCRSVNYADLPQACSRPMTDLNLCCNYGNLGFILNHFYDKIGTTTRTDNDQVSNSNFGCLSSDKLATGL